MAFRGMRPYGGDVATQVERQREARGDQDHKRPPDGMPPARPYHRKGADDLDREAQAHGEDESFELVLHRESREGSPPGDQTGGCQHQQRTAGAGRAGEADRRRCDR